MVEFGFVYFGLGVFTKVEEMYGQKHSEYEVAHHLSPSLLVWINMSDVTSAVGTMEG